MIQAAPLEAYSKQDREFYAFWYSHMKGDLMQPPLADISHSTARYIWDSAIAAKPQSSGGEVVAWRLRASVESCGLQRFMTQAKYEKQTPAIKKWYEPFKCQSCATPKPEPMTPEPKAAPKLIGWRTSDYLMETADKSKADNWSVHHEMLPIFEGDPHTKLGSHGITAQGAQEGV